MKVCNHLLSARATLSNEFCLAMALSLDCTHLKHSCIEVDTPPSGYCIMVVQHPEKHVHEQGLATANAAVNVQACIEDNLVHDSTNRYLYAAA